MHAEKGGEEKQTNNQSPLFPSVSSSLLRLGGLLGLLGLLLASLLLGRLLFLRRRLLLGAILGSLLFAALLALLALCA